MDEKKLVIDIFRTKTADDFTKAIADPDGKLETGSAAADAAAIAASAARRSSRQRPSRIMTASTTLPATVTLSAVTWCTSLTRM